MKPEWLIKRKDAARKAGATAVYRGKKDGSLLPQSSRKCEVGAECDGGIHYHHDSIKEQSGTGTWGMDQIVDCTASCPPEVYDALDEAIIEELDR